MSVAVMAAASLMLAAAISFAQPGSRTAPFAGVKITGEVAHPLSLGMANLAAIAHRSVSVTDKQGAAQYGGVAVVDLLRRAGAPLGAELRGPKMKLYVLVKARDGYAAVFALAEFDPAFTSRIILLADQRDGHPLGTVEGPLRIIVPDEKRYARWVRQVIEIEVRMAQ